MILPWKTPEELFRHNDHANAAPHPVRGTDKEQVGITLGDVFLAFQ